MSINNNSTSIKILVYLNPYATYLPYGTLKYLQDKVDCKIYAIVDTNSDGKEFFKTQKLVRFEKIWFYRDSLSFNKQGHNLGTLSSYERKYKIDLWLVAYCERFFYEFNDYHKFSPNEILNILEYDLKFFSEILEEIKPSFVMYTNIDNHKGHILQELCKALNIKILSSGVARLGVRWLISQEPENMDEPIVRKQYPYESPKIDFKTILLENDYNKQAKRFMKKTDIRLHHKIRAFLGLLSLMNSKDYKRYYGNYGRSALNILKRHFILTIKRWEREKYLRKNCLADISLKENFIYFPLHFQPEASSSIYAPFHTNQIEIISQIARSIPIGYKLFVKEHFAMKTMYWRDISFYKKIKELPNVELIHHTIGVERILENCKAVVTINGTVALEALFYRKPVILFAKNAFKLMPCVYRVSNVEDLPKIISQALNQHIFDDKAFYEFLNQLIDSSIPIDVNSIIADMMNRFFYLGSFESKKITEIEMEKFLKEYEKEFQTLADEHIKKIRLHQQCLLK